MTMLMDSELVSFSVTQHLEHIFFCYCCFIFHSVTIPARALMSDLGALLCQSKARKRLRFYCLVIYFPFYVCHQTNSSVISSLSPTESVPVINTHASYRGLFRNCSSRSVHFKALTRKSNFCSQVREVDFLAN